MTVEEYANYKRDPEINRDMAADSPSDTVVIDWLAHKLDTAQAVLSERQASSARVRKYLHGVLSMVDPATGERLVSTDAYKALVRDVVQSGNRT
jgi:hypothetical protein